MTDKILKTLVLLIGTFITLKAVGIAEEIEKGLYGYWSFDEGKGEITLDKSENANHGIVHGAKWVKGKSGYALEFDGVDDYVDCGKNTAIKGKELTISLWIKFLSEPSKVNAHIVCRNYYLGFWGKRENPVHFSFYVGGKDFAGMMAGKEYRFVKGKWYHIAATYDYDIAEMRIYVNGECIATHDEARLIVAGNPNKPLRIGTGDGGAHFKGIVDEVRIYNRALSADEIKSLYENFNRN